MTPTKPPRSEAYWLAMTVALIHALLLGFLMLVAWRSPFMIFRFPDKLPAAANVEPAQPGETKPL